MPWPTSKSKVYEDLPTNDAAAPSAPAAALEEGSDDGGEIDRQPSVTRSTRSEGANIIGASRPALAGTTTPSRSKSTKSANEPETRWRRFLRAMGFVPWGAILSSMLLIAGLAITVIKGKAAGDTGKALLAAAGSANTGFYPKGMDVFNTSWVVTLGLTGGCIALVLFIAAGRLSQKLRKAGRGDKGKWSRCCFGFMHYTAGLAMVFLLLCTLWFLANFFFLVTWGVSPWMVKDGSAAVLATSTELAKAAADYNTTLTALPGTLKQAITNTTNLQRVSAALKPKLEDLALMAPNLLPTGRPLKAEVETSQDLVCPSLACMNMNLYPTLESQKCLCSEATVKGLQAAANAAYDSLTWPLIGFACLVLGGLVASMQLAADSVMITADQAWMTVMRRKSRGVNRSPTKPLGTSFSDPEKGQFMTTPGSTLPKRSMPYMTSPSIYGMHARASQGV